MICQIKSDLLQFILNPFVYDKANGIEISLFFYRTLFSLRTRFIHHNFNNLSVDMLHAF